MQARTLFLSKLLGLYALLAAVAMASHRQLTVQAVTDLLHSPSQLLVLGAFTTLAGLAMVLLHNRWNGGSLTLMITLLSWLCLFKGLLFLLLPPAAESAFFLNLLDYADLFYLWTGVVFLLGAWLTWGGFTARPSNS